MRIAIVGGGACGLVCAHMLHRDHELVVFEAADRAGGHANTQMTLAKPGWRQYAGPTNAYRAPRALAS
jgi:predicted NAD/FAD-binding protein